MPETNTNVKERVWPNGKTIQRLLVQYIDVGQLSALDADKFIANMNTAPGWASVIAQLEQQGIAVVNIPVRAGSETRLEMVPVMDDDFDDSSFDIMIHPNPSERTELEYDSEYD